MEAAENDVLSEMLARLRGGHPEAARLLDRLRAPAFELSHLAPISPAKGRSSWLARWKVGDALRERFQLAPELLMLVSPWREAQARDVEGVERALGNQLKCDRGLVLVLSFDDDVRRRLRAVFAATHREWVVLDRARLADAVDVSSWLRRCLLEHLGARDLFGATTPVSGWDFFGREREIADLRRTLLEGRPVCVYGLGKVGKSSLLKRLRSEWMEAGRGEGGSSGRVIPVHVDLQAVAPDEKDHTGVMRQVLASTVATLDAMAIDLRAAGLERRHRAWETIADMAAAEVRTTAHNGLRALVRHLETDGGAVVVMLDEYERLYGADRGIPPAQGLLVLDELRGLTQQFPGRFNFVLVGRSRAYAQHPRNGGEVNPLYNFATYLPVAGLERSALKELIDRVGARVGMTFDDGALEVVVDESGGHPFLARQLCRAVERPIPISKREPPSLVTRAGVEARVPDFRREVRWTMEEILHAVQQFDVDAPSFLRALDGAAPSFVRAVGWRPEVVEELRAIGVLRPSDDGSCGVRIGAFRSWLHNNWRAMELARAAG